MLNKTRLQKIITLLNDEILRLEDDLQVVTEKKDAIDEKASNRDSGEMTDKEQERYEKLESIEDLINNVIDSMNDSVQAYEELEEEIDN